MTRTLTIALLISCVVCYPTKTRSYDTTPEPNSPNKIEILVCGLEPLPNAIGLENQPRWRIQKWWKDITDNVTLLRKEKQWIETDNVGNTTEAKAKRFLSAFLRTTHNRVRWAVQLDLAKKHDNVYQISALASVAQNTVLVRMTRNEQLADWQKQLCQPPPNEPPPC